MLFGKPRDEKKERGMPAPLRRQLFLLVSLLAGVALLGLQYLPLGPKKESPSRPSPGAIFGPQLDDSDPAFPLPEIVDPEPFEERPDILARGKEVDKKRRFDDTLIAYLLQKVRTRDIYQEQPVLSHDREEDDVFQQLISQPDRYRGKLVAVRGVLACPPGELPLRLVGIDAPNPSGMDRMYQSFIMGVEDKYYMVATVGKAKGGKPIQYNDYVRLRAYFCQLFSYPVQLKDGRNVTAIIPVLVGDTYELLDRPRSGTPWTSEYLPLLGALGAFAVAAVVLLQGRSRSRFQRRRIEARRESRVAREELPPDLEAVEEEPSPPVGPGDAEKEGDA